MTKKQTWALILGGSSGFGLAAAHKLSRHGMNLCLVHRDRRSGLETAEKEFAKIRERGVELITYNRNALAAEDREQILDELKGRMGEGRIRLMLHSIAAGNLKLLAPMDPGAAVRHQALVGKLAAARKAEPEEITRTLDSLFEEGETMLHGVATPPDYGDALLSEQDFEGTIYAMGTSLASWMQSVFERGLFAPDARVLGMTSEGNEVAWRGYAAVSAAKAALEAVARSAAAEYAPYGIRTNIIQAGVTDTPALRAIPGSAQLKASSLGRNPFKRLTTPEDVAGFIYLMTLDEAAWVNGALIRVDGGEHISG